MGKIKILPSELINKIAAGEVVERPASVVKELVENSLDAGASRITIEIEEGGKRLIRVTDDGVGMSREDLILSVQQHSTSKISDERDLYAIRTMGFRGEALASIGAVSDMTIISRERGSTEGWKLHVKGGSMEEPVPTNCMEGTDIIVRTLFLNTPARLRFLKRPTTEEYYIRNIVIQHAISHWEKGFYFKSDRRMKLNLSPADSPLQRIKDIFKTEDFVDDLKELAYSRDRIHIRGVYAPPSHTRKRSNYIYTFVNGRPIKNRSLEMVIINSFRQVIPGDRFPIFFLFLEIPPEWVDVNVHPAKLEVKFFNEQKIKNSVARAIQDILLKDTGSIPLNEFSTVHEDHDHRSYGSSDQRLFSGNVFTSDIYHTDSDFLQEGDDIKILGQAFGTYIIFQKGEELYFMDQHATHEKIIYVGLLKSYRNHGLDAQQLLLPIQLKLSDTELETLVKNLPYLESLGFKFQIDDQVELKAYPSVIDTEDISLLIKEILNDLQEEGEPLSLNDYIERIVATIACKSAIKGNTQLSMSRMIHLIKEAEKVSESRYCPHGRPAILKLTRTQFEKIFLRNEH